MLKGAGNTVKIPDSGAGPDTPHCMLLDLSPASMRSASPLASTLDPFAMSHSSVLLPANQDQSRTQASTPSAAHQSSDQPEQRLFSDHGSDSLLEFGQIDSAHLGQSARGSVGLDSAQWPPAPSWR